MTSSLYRLQNVLSLYTCKATFCCDRSLSRTQWIYNWTNYFHTLNQTQTYVMLIFVIKKKWCLKGRNNLGFLHSKCKINILKGKVTEKGDLHLLVHSHQRPELGQCEANSSFQESHKGIGAQELRPPPHSFSDRQLEWKRSSWDSSWWTYGIPAPHQRLNQLCHSTIPTINTLNNAISYNNLKLSL